MEGIVRVGRVVNKRGTEQYRGATSRGSSGHPELECELRAQTLREEGQSERPNLLLPPTSLLPEPPIGSTPAEAGGQRGNSLSFGAQRGGAMGSFQSEVFSGPGTQGGGAGWSGVRAEGQDACGASRDVREGTPGAQEAAAWREVCDV